MRAYTQPMMLSGLGAWDYVQALEPLPLKAGQDGALYDERWLQQLIQEFPMLLPVDQIEPALTPLVPICMELPLPSGFADNLLLTPDGGIVVVEAKLWRNPEARREVVGQVLDYAKDLSALSYEDLQARARLARKDASLDLFLATRRDGAEDASEAAFVDAVSRNLRLGRMLLIIAGDGIQERAEQLADFLQRHMGLHFTLAMVEIGLWRAPDTGVIFVQPKILTRTVQIERAVIRLEEGVALRPSELAPASPQAKPTNLSQEAFYDALRFVDSTLPDRLQAFLTGVEPLGVYPDVKRHMSLKWQAPDGRTFQLGVIDPAGRFNIEYAHWSAQSIGRLDLSHAYQAQLAAAVPGASVRETPKPTGWYIVYQGGPLPLTALLDHGEAWKAATADYLDALRRALESPEAA